MSSYWQGKGAGKRIAIRFNKPLLGDVSGNEGAFTVTGMVRNPLKTGELQPVQFTVDSVERYPVATLYEDDFTGTMDGVEVGGNGVVLALPFSPAIIPGLQLWLDAGQGVTKDENDLVSEWTDLSGNNNNATGVGTGRPLLVDNEINGEPVLRFNGSTNGMEIPNLNAASNFTLFVVMKSEIPSASTLVLTNDPIQFGFRPDSSSFITIYSQREASYSDYVSNEANVVTLNSNPSLWTNGIEASYGPTRNFGGLGYWIGRRDSGNYYSGDIAEIIIYNSELSTTDREAVEAYLIDKYGIGGA